MKQGKLKHLDYDKETQDADLAQAQGRQMPAREQAFYEQLAFCDVADVFRFVNGAMPVPGGADAAAAALCQEGRRRRTA